MRLTSTGLGIGTSSPGSKLDVRGVITGGDGTIQTVISYLASAGVTGTLSNHPYVFYANNAERYRIGTAGQLGIGGANYGTTGQVLTSNGSGSAPSWQDGGGGGSTTDAVNHAFALSYFNSI